VVVFDGLDVQVKGRGFNAPHTEETPIIDGCEFNQGAFARVGRGVLVDEGLTKVLV
jgi:hypothetical protein